MMRTYFESGAAYAVLTLICLIGAVITENRAIFLLLGAFWLIATFVARAKYRKRKTV